MLQVERDLETAMTELANLILDAEDAQAKQAVLVQHIKTQCTSKQLATVNKACDLGWSVLKSNNSIVILSNNTSEMHVDKCGGYTRH